jgi:hypothetical protein
MVKKIANIAIGRTPHAERMAGIDTIHENPYAIRKNESRGRCRIICRRPPEESADRVDVVEASMLTILSMGGRSHPGGADILRFSGS